MPTAHDAALPQTLWARTSWKMALWCVFLGLSGFILAYPIDLGPESVPRLSPDLFPNLPLFGFLLYLWTAIMLVLLVSPAAERSAQWERLALVMIAALILRGFWNIKVPIQGQAYVHVNAAKAWESVGHIVHHPAGGYFDWPGVSLLYATVSQISGLAVHHSMAMLGVFITVAMAAASYVFLLGVLKSSFSAAFGSLLIVAGNLAAVMYVTAGPTAMVFVVAFLAVLFQRGSLAWSQRALIAVLLLAGAAVTHFHSAMHFFFFLLGVRALQLFRRLQRAVPSTTAITMVFFILPLAWLMFWGLSAFVWVTQAGWTFVSHPVDFWQKFTGLLTVGQSNFGEVVPQWYRLTRLVWLAVLYVPGGLLWLVRLRQSRTLEPREGELSAAFFGLILLNLLTSLTSPRGFGELLRGLTYVPFFTTPFLFLSLRSLNPWVKKVSMVGLAVVLGSLALPTFLANNYRVNTLAPHRTEYAVGQWLASLYGSGKGLQIFLTHPIFGATQLYLIDATYTSDREAESTGYTSESRWAAMDALLDAFSDFSRTARFGFFVQSPKIAVVSNLTFNVPLNDPRWDAIPRRLSAEYPRIYDNGPSAVYASR